MVMSYLTKCIATFISSGQSFLALFVIFTGWRFKLGADGGELENFFLSHFSAIN